MTLIHQITLGNTVPRLNRECLASWRGLTNRGFDVLSWTEERVASFLATCAVPEARTLYAKARNYGEASDIARIAITYTYGGLYVDWDVLLVDPEKLVRLLADLDNSDCIVIRDAFTKEPDFPYIYDNSLFYLRKGHPLALDFLRHMAASYNGRPLPDTPYLTGPHALTHFLRLHPDHERACRAIDMREIYAFDYEGVIGHTPDQTRREVLKDYCSAGGAPAVHFWTHTWFPERTWTRRVLDRLVKTVNIARSAI